MCPGSVPGPGGAQAASSGQPAEPTGWLGQASLGRAGRDPGWWQMGRLILSQRLKKTSLHISGNIFF